MAEIKMTMQALGSEPQTCHRPFVRGDTMTAVEFADGEPAGWHTGECIEYWKQHDTALCAEKGGE